MGLSEEEKEAIEDFRKNYENDLSRYDDFNSYTQFIVRRNGTILNLIEKLQEEIDTWEETENDYEHELARKDEKIEKQRQKIKELKEEISDLKWKYSKF